jgi:hypothetical protein
MGLMLFAMQRSRLIFFFFMLFMLLISTVLVHVEEAMQINKPTLPVNIGMWKKADSFKKITSKNIFDYMNGAGELYVGYRFDHLEVYEYTSQEQEDILVDLYFMKTSDDAFGLLSLDWGGESVDLNKTQIAASGTERYIWPRALYGEGLLRLWSDKMYARVMAYRDTPESKKAVLTIGHSIVKGRRNPPIPSMLKSFPDSIQSKWLLKKDRTSFFRSHLVFNSLYYLGHENMLDLNLTSEAVISSYERLSAEEVNRIPLLFIKYGSNELALSAIKHFHSTYLPEYSVSLEQSFYVFPVENSWLGYKIQDNIVAFVFECPDEKTIRAILSEI